jgi:hypothetical protein
MPTGYTANIEKGISFKEYAMGCARAFGACIEMRDSSKDTPIPEEFPVSDHNLLELKDAKLRLALLKKMSVSDAQKEAKEEYEYSVKTKDRMLKVKTEVLKKYEKMLEEVNKWRAPSPDHIEFKEFMVSQIRDSINWDCSTKYVLEIKPKLESGKEWLKRNIKIAEDDIAHHTKKHNEEVERVKGRNQWIKQLRESLKGL